MTHQRKKHGMEACTSFCCQNQSVNHGTQIKSLGNVERLLVKVFVGINILKKEFDEKLRNFSRIYLMVLFDFNEK